MSAHAVGPKGEGGLDDATGAGGAGGASMKQSSGVVDLGKHQSPPHSGTVRLSPHAGSERAIASASHCISV